MWYLWATLLIAVNTVWLLAVIIGLPGTWLMLACTALLAWWQRDAGMFSSYTLIAILILAIVGEILEFVAAIFGARKAGAKAAGSAGAIIGALLGGIVAVPLIPVPLLGPLIGACAGAFAGAMLTELSAGRHTRQAMRTGIGAGTGRFLGTAAKFAVGVMIWLIVALAAFWP